jgi:pimeloyl-ACP methyl ester carboxylesterase
MRCLLPLVLSLVLAACAHRSSPPQESAPQAAACPAELPPGTRCLQGRDSAGAFYLVALPAQWSGTLVLHAHGGPTLGAPTLERTAEDLKRWAVVVKAGHAWAGSSFRQGGVAVRAAAEDTERLRRIFLQHVAQPRLTLLHGQSWGASVAAVGASVYTDDGQGRRPYDAVLLSSGVLAGGSKAYDFRLDLRVLYQALCGDHPRAEEASYPLWQGLPPGRELDAAELRRRVDACLGLDRPAAQRTPEQQHKLRTLTTVLKIPAESIPGHLAWATWHFQDIAQRLGGRNVFGNDRVQYRGSDDDAALNAAVARYRTDPAAVADFAADADPDGRIPVPVLTVHGIDDPTAFVEMDHSFRETMDRAGTASHLVQTFTADRTHSYLSDPVYATLFAELSQWARGGVRPTPTGIAQRCLGFEPTFGPGCRFRPDYQPQPLSTRVAPRG